MISMAMRSWKRWIYVAVVVTVLCFTFSNAKRTPTDDEKRAAKNIALHSSSVEEVSHLPTVTEQEQIDGILSAFRKLPSEELSRLGVDISREYVAGTEGAASLREAWTLRQAELKDLMERQLNAAEYMTTIAGYLVNSSVTDDELLIHLDDLEQLLADIDNARDFHTVGGWPNLTSLLPGMTDRSVSVQSKAVHCVGTAIKNDYDFQLWMLESAGDSSQSVLDLLLSAVSLNFEKIVHHAIDESETVKADFDILQRRILYALSAALRGNMDVQEAAMSSTSPSVLSSLQTCVEASGPSLDVKRKCWHIVSDLLDEMVYIRDDVANEYAAMQRRQDEELAQDVTGDTVASAESVLAILKDLRPMGMTFIAPEHRWLLLAERVAAEIASKCSLDGEGNNSEVNSAHEDSCVFRTSPPVRDIFAHVAKVKSVLRSEYGNDLQDFANGNEGQVEELRKLETQFGSDVDLFLKHPLMQDTLY